MLGLIAVLFLLLAGAIVMAFELLRPAKQEEGGLDLDALRRDYARPDPYAPMARLLGDDEEAFLREQSASCEHLRSKLRKQRRKAVRLYVKRMGADFDSTWRLCKLLAPISEDPNFVVRLGSAALRFHILHALVRVTLAIGADGFVRTRVSELTAIGSDLRSTAHTLLDSAATWTPAAAPTA